jgi:hypothetical protein
MSVMTAIIRHNPRTFPTGFRFLRSQDTRGRMEKPVGLEWDPILHYR